MLNYFRIFSDMAKHTNIPHGTVSQSPTVADKKKNLETIINRIHLAHRTDHKNKGNSTKDVLDSAKQGILDSDLNIDGIDELLDYFRDSNSVPRTVRKMLTSKDAKVLDSNVCNKKYPTCPCYIYLKTLNIWLMKPK